MSQIAVAIGGTRLDELARILQGVRNGVKRCAVRAINKTARWMRTRVIRTIASKSGMTQALVRKRHVRLKSANYREMSAYITIRGGATKLKYLAPRQTRRGVTFKNPATGARELRAHAFFLPGGKGNGQVFRRAAGGGPSGLVPKTPIELQSASSVVDAIDVREAERDVGERLALEVDRQVEVLLEQSR